MSVTVGLTNNVAARCEQVLTEASGDGRALVWLLRDYDRALECRKDLAHRRSPLRMGCTVSSLYAWIDDCWGLHGDGRLIVDGMQRRIIMCRALRESGVFAPTPGTVNLMSDMVQRGSGLAAFRAALNGEVDGLSAVELQMMEVARLYRSYLDERDLIERSEAMLHLVNRRDVAWPTVVCEGFDSLNLPEAAFFATLCDKADVHFVQHCYAGSLFDSGADIASALTFAGASARRERVSFDYENDGVSDELRDLSAALYYPDALDPVKATGAVRALLPAGRYARAFLLAQEIASVEGAVLVACADPANLFNEIVERLVGVGASVEVSCSRSFVQTDFGGALLNAIGILNGDELDTFQATDFTLSVLADMGLRSVYAFDEKWRSNRLTDSSGVLDDVCDYAPETAAPFVGLLEAGRIAEALEMAESRYRDCRTISEAFRVEQLAAISCAKNVFFQAEQLGEGVETALELLAQSALPLHVAVVPSGDDRSECAVRIVSYAEAAKAAPASYKAVFACDMNASEQSLLQRRTSVDELFSHMGCVHEHDALFEARLRMANVVAAARETLVLVRALHDEKAEPTYPAVVFEDVVDCYRSRPTDAAELDKSTSLHPSLLPFAVSAGEESLVRNLSHGGEPCLRMLPLGAPCAVTSDSMDMHLDPLRVRSAREAGRIRWEGQESSLLLSPSAVESYLDCPYKWFAMRRLRLNCVDAAFSAREKGTFVHEVLESFYRLFAYEFGAAKPDVDRLAEAKRLLEGVFGETLKAQMTKDPGAAPFIPLTQAELRETDALLVHLKEFIERDARLAPGFLPQYFEYRFGRERPCEYAGVMLTGCIDRIDVDDKGRAVVVDYKSSLSDAYFLLPSKKAESDGPFVLPRKVQTLIYAQVVRRELGLRPAGALYLNTQRTGSKPSVCGAYDDHVFDAKTDLLGVMEKRNGLSYTPFASFEDLLDAVEELIAARLERLAAGDIMFDPSSDKSCEFCPVLSCEGRK